MAVTGEGIVIEFEGNTVKFDKSVDGVKKALTVLKAQTQAYKKEFAKTNNLNALNKQLRSLIQEQNTARYGVKLWAEEVARLAKIGKDRTDEEEKEYKSALKNYARMKTQLLNIEKNIEKCTQAMEEFVETDFDKFMDDLEKTSDKFESIASATKNAADAIKPLSDAAQKGLKASADAAIDFESAFADVLKTVSVEGSQAQQDAFFSDLRQQVIELSKELPVAASDIAKIMGLAGQMNVPNEQLVDFTRNMIKFGDSTNISAEEAAQSIAQVYNVIGKGQDFSTINNLLSAIVDLGNNSATTERDMVEMFTNIAAASYRVGMTESQMAALAATLSSLNLDKGGASAISKILSNIDMQVDTNGKKLSVWADTAGMSVSKFKEAWQTDAAGALTAVLTGMSKTVDEGDSLNVLLSELGVKEIRQVDTLSRLVNAQELYAQNIDRSNKAYEEGNALNVEAEKRYKTVAARIQVLKNSFQAFAIAIGDTFMPLINQVIDALMKVAQWLNALSPQQKEMISIIASIVASLAPLLLGISAVASKLSDFTGGTLVDLLKNNKALFPILQNIGNWVTGFLSSPLPLLIAGLIALYASSEDFRNAVNKLAESMGGLLYAAFNLIKEVAILVWNTFKALVEVVKAMWEAFAQSEGGKKLIEILTQIFGWIEKIIDAITWLINLVGGAIGGLNSLLGVAKDVQSINLGSIGGLGGGTGGRVWIESGGFMSGGITVNNTFTINGIEQLSHNRLMEVADEITDRVNENLGRSYA